MSLRKRFLLGVIAGASFTRLCFIDIAGVSQTINQDVLVLQDAVSNDESSSSSMVSTRRLLEQVVTDDSQILLTPQGQIDWERYDHAYYFHTRKAGGTTLLNWARDVAWKHNVSFSSDEGYVFEEENFQQYKNGTCVLRQSLI